MATNQTPSSIAPGSLDAWEYLASYADLRGVYGTDTVGAAQHYTDFGISEGRAITFDAWVYMASHDDLLNFYGSSLDAMGAASHYVIFGAAEGRATNTFDAIAYINDPGNTDLLAAFGGDADGGRSNGAEHYVTFGRSEIASGLRDSSGQNTGAGDFVLTAGVDNYPGTLDNSGNDTLTATEATLTAGDNLNGGGGSDALNYWTNVGGNHGAFTMTNVERLQATADLLSTSTFDLSGTTGVTTFASVNTTGNLVFSQVTGLAALEVQNMTTGGDVTISYQDAVVAGGSDAMDLNLINNGNTGIGTLLIGSTSNTDSGIETLNINTSQAATRVDMLDADVATLNIAGDQNLEIVKPLDSNISTVDASGLSANLDLDMTNQLVDQTFTGAQGDDTITWAGIGNSVTANSGTGDDSLIMGDAADDVDGGAGDDQISGNVGADDISGGAGADVIDGGTGADVIDGDAGVDRITGGTGADDIDGGDGNDVIDGGADADDITGGAGADSITGGEGVDDILGGAGADVIDLTETASAADNVIYSQESDAGTPGLFGPLDSSEGDSITGFLPGTDDLAFTGDYLFQNMPGTLQNGASAFTEGDTINLDANGTGDDTVFVIASDGTTASVLQDLPDLLNIVDLQAAFTIANETVGDERIFVVTDDGSTTDGAFDAAVFRFVSNTADNVVDNSELSLLGVVNDTTAAVTIADIDFV